MELIENVVFAIFYQFIDHLCRYTFKVDICKFNMRSICHRCGFFMHIAMRRVDWVIDFGI